MNDPNIDPGNPTPRETGNRNIVWIVIAILVVVAVVWYVMRDNGAVPPADVPATIETPVAPADTQPIEAPDEALPTEAPADTAPTDTVPEATDGGAADETTAPGQGTTP